MNAELCSDAMLWSCTMDAVDRSANKGRFSGELKCFRGKQRTAFECKKMRPACFYTGWLFWHERASEQQEHIRAKRSVPARSSHGGTDRRRRHRPRANKLAQTSKTRVDNASAFDRWQHRFHVDAANSRRAANVRNAPHPALPDAMVSAAGNDGTTWRTSGPLWSTRQKWYNYVAYVGMVVVG